MSLLSCATLALLLQTLVKLGEPAVKFGELASFELTSFHQETFRRQASEDRPHVREDEVVRVQVNSAGKRSERATVSRPVTLSVSTADERMEWTVPWWPGSRGSGPIQEHRQILLCTHETDDTQVRMTAHTNSTHAVKLAWKVQTENVALKRSAQMKSTLSDVSYRRYRWQKSEVEVDIEIESVKGADVCGSIMVTDFCTKNPLEVDRIQQLHNFTESVQFTVRRVQVPDDFWLYLLPQWNPDHCSNTAGLPIEPNGPQAKTIRLYTTGRAFKSQRSVPERTPRSEPASSALQQTSAASSSSWADQDAPVDSCRLQTNQLRQEILQLRDRADRCCARP